jgi:hypothetical protein
LDSPPYTIDPQVLAPFDARNTAFGRRHWDRGAAFYDQAVHDNAAHVIAAGRRGRTRIEYARLRAAWAVYDHFDGAFSWKPLDAPDAVARHFGPVEVSDRAAMSAQIKETARLYGAALAGVCAVDRRWIYTHDRNGRPIDVPERFRYAIVMAIPMDLEGIMGSPTYRAGTATGVGYSRMAYAIACMAEFIRHLGYSALPMGNDTALSIPLAIDAGLGELGRLGLLITPEYGPCVRLCKVFTDMPLAPDGPIEFGIAKFCRACDRCSGGCPAGAIQTGREPSYEVVCPSNNRGILRWAVNADKCYSYWVENGASCSNCIALCPFTRRALRRQR